MGDSNTNGITASYQLASHDVVRDVTMTSPGMSSQDGPQLRDLGKLFDRQIEMLQTLKIEALNTQQALEGKITLLEKEGKELKAKLISREAEIVHLKQEMKKLSQLASSAEQSSSLSAGSSDTDSPNWRKRYEDMKTMYEDLKHRQLQGCSLPGSGNHRNRDVVVTASPLIGAPGHGVQGAGDGVNREIFPTSLPSIQQKSSKALQLVEVDHAYDLADRVSVIQFRHVLRKLHVSDTDITNLDMNRLDAKEYFVQGIKSWKSEAGGKASVQALIKAMLDLKLRLEAQEFCDQFGFVCPQEEKDECLSQISAFQDFTDGDSPAVFTPAYTPKSKLDTILHPFLLDPCGFDDLNQGLSNQSSFDGEEVEKFAKLFNIKSRDYDLFKSAISVAGETVGPDVILEAWAEVEVQKTPSSRKQSVHSLGKVLRELQRRDIRHILLSHLESGLLGPWLDNKVFFRDRRVPYSFARDLGHLLSSSMIGQADWHSFASDVGFSEYIKQFEQRPNPGMEVLDAWKTRKESTIGYLYSWAKEKDRMDIVKVLEEGDKH